MKSAMRRTVFREIKTSLGRFLAILAIIALGVGFFAGLKVTTPAMLKTADSYFDDTLFMDMRLLSTMGFTYEDIDALNNMEGIETAVPSYSLDVITEDSLESRVFKIHSLSDFINIPVLVEGRMPQNANECLLDALLIDSDTWKIGANITISDENDEDTLEMLDSRELTVVGVINTSNYINFQRGNTSLGNGSISGYIYILSEAFSSEAYPEILLRFDGATELACYTNEYNTFIDEMKDKLEVFAEEREDIRYETIVYDAEKELANAQTELDDESAKAEKELADAEAKIENAKADIMDAKTTIKENQQLIEDGNDQLQTALVTADDNEKEINNGLTALSVAKAAAEEQFSQSKLQIEEMLSQVDLLESNGQIEAAKALQAQAAAAQLQLSTAMKMTNDEFVEQQANLDAGFSKIQLAREQIAAKQIELTNAQSELDTARQELEKAELELLDAEKEYAQQKANALQKISDAQSEIDDGREELSSLEKPEWYLLDRTTNTGYVGFENDAKRPRKILCKCE